MIAIAALGLYAIGLILLVALPGLWCFFGAALLVAAVWVAWVPRRRLRQ